MGARIGQERMGWLVVFAEIDGLRWVVKNRRMAFSAGTCPRASQINPGDDLILYVARGAFHNPTRDRSRLGGLATVNSSVTPFRRPVKIAEREFTCGCDLDIRLLLPERQGVPMDPLVLKLRFIKRKDRWGSYLRGGLIPLPRRDFRMLVRELERVPQGRPADDAS
jgi:hypothetical protein